MQEQIIIEKLTFEMEVNSEQEYHELAHHLEHQIYGAVVKTLEEQLPNILDGTTIEDHIIEKIELDLPTLPLSVLSSSHLIVEITKCIQQPAKHTLHTPKSPIKSNAPPSEQLAIDKSTLFKEKAVASSFRIFQYYLLTGRFPTGQELDWKDIVQFTETESKRQILLKWIKGIPNPTHQTIVMQRLALQLPPTQRSIVFKDSIIQHLVKNTPQLSGLRPLTAEGQEPDSTALPLPILNKSVPPMPTPQEGLYLENAGVVILAPFLPALFEKSKLLDKSRKRFRDVNSAFYAIHLMEYMVNKSVLSSEHKAPLLKILCGLPVDTPIALRMEPQEEHLQMIDRLLLQVTKSWDVKLGSNINMLRGSFLIRNGKISEQDKYWLLQVESKMYDKHLLAKLPWSIKRIKLPWMEKILQVDWY